MYVFVCVYVCICDTEGIVKPYKLSETWLEFRHGNVSLFTYCFSVIDIGHAGSVGKTEARQMSILFTMPPQDLGYSFKRAGRMDPRDTDTGRRSQVSTGSNQPSSKFTPLHHIPNEEREMC